MFIREQHLEKERTMTKLFVIGATILILTAANLTLANQLFARTAVPENKPANKLESLERAPTPPDVSQFQQFGEDERLLGGNLFFGLVKQYRIPGTEAPVAAAYSFPWSPGKIGILMWLRNEGGGQARSFVALPGNIILNDVMTFHVGIHSATEGLVTAVTVDFKNKDDVVMVKYIFVLTP